MADLGRPVVGLIVVSSTVHLVLAWQAPNVGARLALVAMAAACLGCARHLWRGGSVHAWMTMVGLTGVMVYAHWSLCFACGPEVHHSAGRSGLSTVALVLMAAELALSTAAVLHLLLHPNPNREAFPS
jgi:hypothetical protein